MLGTTLWRKAAKIAATSEARHLVFLDTNSSQPCIRQRCFPMSVAVYCAEQSVEQFRDSPRGKLGLSSFIEAYKLSHLLINLWGYLCALMEPYRMFYFKSYVYASFSFNGHCMSALFTSVFKIDLVIELVILFVYSSISSIYYQKIIYFLNSIKI